MIDGPMNATMYQTILQNHMFSSARRLRGQKYVFQHDNDPKHTAKKTAGFLKKRKVEVMDWPSQSPDLNPIEMMWTELKNALVRRNPQNLPELRSICVEEWQKIPQEHCQNLVKGYKRRLQAVIDGHTKY